MYTIYTHQPLILLSGPAYLMSSTTAAKLYRVSMETPVIHLEDVYTTGILAARCADNDKTILPFCRFVYIM